MRSISLYASELRRAREAVGMSQEQLAQAMNFSQSLVAQVEGGRKPPSADFTNQADAILKTDGLLSRIRSHNLTQDAIPDWFRSWTDIEQQATALRIYAPVLVPGLLQTEEYARAVMRFVGEPEVQLEGRVAARMQRQEVLARDHPPEIVMVLDERIIRCPVGSPDVMREQLVRLAEAAERHLIQVVPLTAETYHGLVGPFEIATVDGVESVYTDTQLRGYVSGSGEAVTEAKRRWDAIRAEAVSRRQSIDMIMEAAKSWSS